MADSRYGVRYAPLDPIDFEARPEMTHSGWPMSYDSMRRHYEAANELCEAGPFEYSPTGWTEGTDGPWELDAGAVESKVFQFGPRDAFFGRAVEQITAAPEHQSILAGATAVELVASDSTAAVEAVRCRRLDGATITIRAKRVVVAGGGLGNPHLLLASNSQRPAGLGNSNDLVGRFLQDHPLIDGGSLRMFDRAMWPRSTFYDMRLVDGHSALGYLALSPAAIREHDLRGLSTVLFPRPSLRRSRGFALYKDLVEAARTHNFGMAQARQVPRALMSADYVPTAYRKSSTANRSTTASVEAGGRTCRTANKFARWEVIHQAEQSPDPTNRVTLSRRTDRIGMPVLNVNWRWSEPMSPRRRRPPTRRSSLGGRRDRTRRVARRRRSSGDRDRGGHRASHGHDPDARVPDPGRGRSQWSPPRFAQRG
ncbi:MAG: GMC family oxidoreductase N-terminal domain-containing protein [Ilumatobacteraceae bacterium]